MKKYLLCFLLVTFFAFTFGMSFSTQCQANPIQVEFETDSNFPLVYLNIAIKGGSVTDPQEQSGLTHFVGEMLLRGTQLKTKEEIDLALDQMGAKIEVETRPDVQIFRGVTLSSKLQSFMSLVQEILTQPRFLESEIKKQKSETISALKEELGNDAVLASRKFNSFLFQGHPYGNPVLGKVKDIETLSRKAIQEHYQRLFKADQFLIVGSGDTSEAIIAKWAEEWISKLPAKEAGATLSPSPPPRNPTHRALLIVDKPERTQTQIDIGQIGIKMTDPDYFALHLGNHAFGGPSFSATLMTEIRVKRGWSYGAYSHFRFGLQPRSWIVHLFPAAKDTPNALETTLKLITDLRNNGITPAQFEFSKRSLINKAGFMYDTPRKRVENRLLELTLNLPKDFTKSYADRLADVELEDVNQSFKKFLKPEYLAISVLGTAKDLKPALISATQLTEDQVQVIPYTE